MQCDWYPWKKRVRKPRREASEETKPPDPSIWDFQLSEPWENKLLLLKALWHFVPAALAQSQAAGGFKQESTLTACRCLRFSRAASASPLAWHWPYQGRACVCGREGQSRSRPPRLTLTAGTQGREALTRSSQLGRVLLLNINILIKQQPRSDEVTPRLDHFV